MRDVRFNITKDKNDTATYGLEAAFVEMSGELSRLNLSNMIKKVPFITNC